MTPEDVQAIVEVLEGIRRELTTVQLTLVVIMLVLPRYMGQQGIKLRRIAHFRRKAQSRGNQ